MHHWCIICIPPVEWLWIHTIVYEIEQEPITEEEEPQLNQKEWFVGMGSLLLQMLAGENPSLDEVQENQESHNLHWNLWDRLLLPAEKGR